MKKQTVLPLALAAVLGFSACKKELIPGTYESQPVTMGNGQLTSWITFNKEGNPTAVGMSLTDGALEGLPDIGSHPSGNDHANIFEVPLPPTDVTRTPFTHIAVNWNPGGHEPPGIYDKPHFDMHFYIMSSAERKLIPHYEDDTAKFDNFPPADYLPLNFINPGKGEPAMGAHWIDYYAPELPWNGGGEFNQTFVYGTYDGKVTFYEPMLTYSFLKNITEFTRSIPWPAKVQVSGFYPKQMRVKHADGVYTISLEEFEHRTAS